MDNNINQIVTDLFSLQRKLREDQSEQLQDLVKGYILSNGKLIGVAMDAYQKMSDSEKIELYGKKNELDYSATKPDFDQIAGHVLLKAYGVLPRLKISDDDLHMLDRALGYAKYVIDTSNLNVDRRMVV